jgi:hypothetical protein
MAVLIPRYRVVGVRLSEEEYIAMEKFCVENGARSMSDLARSAISSFVNRSNQDSALALLVNQNVAHLKYLEQKLETLSTEFHTFMSNCPGRKE